MMLSDSTLRNTLLRYDNRSIEIESWQEADERGSGYNLSGQGSADFNYEWPKGTIQYFTDGLFTTQECRAVRRSMMSGFLSFNPKQMESQL